MTGKRVDANQKEIVIAMRAVGAHWIDLTKCPTAGMDGLVVFRGAVYLVELKNGRQPASGRRLTDGEKSRKVEVEARGVKYNIITSVEEALRMLGVKI